MRCLDWYGDRSLVVIDVGLACCALEFEAATPEQVEPASVGPGDNAVVVVSGTVTDAVVPMVRTIIDQAPGAKVVSFGACASAGGPYWDSYAVTKGIGQFTEVDVFVPGCPPPPGALRQVFAGLRAR